MRSRSNFLKGLASAISFFLDAQHLDAEHRHIYIVSTNIKSLGERISLHNVERTKLEEMRKALEQRIGLVQAAKNV